jgi:hypothetical protein
LCSIFLLQLRACGQCADIIFLGLWFSSPQVSGPADLATGALYARSSPEHSVRLCPTASSFLLLPQGLVQLGFCPAVLGHGSSRCQQLLFWLRSAILPFTPLPGSVAVTSPASRARSDPRVSASPFAQRRSSQVRFSLKAFCRAMSVGSGCFGSCARFLVHVVVVSWSA